jgi:pimeloyl-ACP methyl ester carboxylesterase
MAADVSSLILGIGLETAVVVGHSMGGFVALSLALHSPELVSGLVLVGTAAMGKVRDLGTGARARTALEMRAGSLADIVRANVEAGVAPAFLRDYPERISRFVDGRVALPPRGRGVEGQRRAAGLFDVRERLWEISCPVLVCHGEDDEVVPVVRGRELASGIRNARLLTWAGLGHYPCLEAPESLGQAIRDFCADL